MKLSALGKAHEARILVAITFHYRVGKLFFLADVLRTLSEFPVDVMRVMLITNTSDAEELGILKRLCDEVSLDHAIKTMDNLAEPVDLAWCHKQFIVSDFLNTKKFEYTHFIYAEDDIRITFQNFMYFVSAREVLRARNLIPSFLRVEYNFFQNGFVNTDNVNRMGYGRRPHLVTDEDIYVDAESPYTACFILDQDLAREYVCTRSFHKESSEDVKDWDVRERAAMGLCWENVPPSFSSRFVVPISKRTAIARPCAWISHLPNNYAAEPDTIFGKVRMDSLFTEPPE